MAKQINRYARTKKLLGQILKEMKVVHEGMIQEALAVQRSEGGQIGQILVRNGHIDEGTLQEGLARQAGMEMTDLSTVNFDEELLGEIDANTARMFNILPVRREGNTLYVALANPSNTAVLEDLRFMTGGEVAGVLAPQEQIDKLVDRHYAGAVDSMRALVDDVVSNVGGGGGGGSSAARGGHVDLEDQEAMANSPPVIKLLQYILFQAIRDRASDIHLEPFESEFKIRYRVDGALYELESPPQHLSLSLISRVKVMSGLDIAETRLPQDGRIEMSIGGRPVDLRISTLPTMYGESCVIRVLDRTVVSLDLEQIGLRDNELATMKHLVQLPHGIVLVTGPTGSGKTTTLYSALNLANDVGVKIITTEEPVEYELDGIMQINVDESIGVSYADCLRAILRQDPDMILVGEIRDPETAQIAVEAALTGHVVFSTLHTNNAAQAVPRMLDLGVEAFLVSATVEAMLAQRLVRTICNGCKVQYEPSYEILTELGLESTDLHGKHFAYGKGCRQCNNTGYKGRTGIYEMIVMSEALREMVMKGASSDALRDQARREGMRTLRESGLLAVFDGITTVEEVIRETTEL
ncbi:MAG: ATPase, T2SS/T4P/T4SS family [Planctomycetota bacterium]|nr:ATPase, T2SS/T4P/T4SS family [Planctomycetota bacterium]